MAAGEARMGSIQIIIKDNFLRKNIDLDSVMREVSAKVPNEYFENIDYMIVGQFDELDSRSVNAAYMDGAIYVTNDQDDESDLVDDIIHEIAHSVEEVFGAFVYGDGKLESEFISKRERLFHLLSGHEEIDLEYQNFLQPEYSREFDNLLYYPLLLIDYLSLHYHHFPILYLH